MSSHCRVISSVPISDSSVQKKTYDPIDLEEIEQMENSSDI
jgi:hypothetical protein